MAEEPDDAVREFADRGVISLLESPRNLAELLRLVDDKVAQRLDFQRAEPVNRSFIPEDLQKREADVVYRVPFRVGKRAAWVYVLVEHQSRTDPTMGLRLLSYMVQLWMTQRRGWDDVRTPSSQRRLHTIVPIVLYSGSRRWPSPVSVAALMDLADALAEYVPTFNSLLLNLRETSPEKLQGSALALALRTMQSADIPRDELTAVLRTVGRGLEELPEASKAELMRALRFVYLLIQHKRRADEQEGLVEAMTEEFEASHRAEAKEAFMTGAQALEAKGRKQGRKEAYCQLLLEQLQTKFGPLDGSQEAALLALDEARMKDLGIRILTAASMDELGLH